MVFARYLKRLNRKNKSEQKNWIDTATYWENRYIKGGNSGNGSYGDLAQYKADFLNNFVKRKGVRTVFELGCGDGNQLSLARYPSYTGYDISAKALSLCQEKHSQDETKKFLLVSELRDSKFELGLSLDVIFHLIEDDLFENYMTDLFGYAEKFVIVYSSNHDQETDANHVKHRCFTKYVDENFPDWKLVHHELNPHRNRRISSPSDFHVFEKL